MSPDFILTSAGISSFIVTDNTQYVKIVAVGMTRIMSYSGDKHPDSEVICVCYTSIIEKLYRCV